MDDGLLISLAVTCDQHKHCSASLQTPVIESINLEYISLCNCPALRAVQKDG